MRSISIALAIFALSLGLLGCDRGSQRTQDDAPSETGHPTAEPAQDEPAQDETDPDAPAEAPPKADVGQMGGESPSDSPDAGPTSDCPEPRRAQGMCAQVITFAQNPDTGTCCEYATPCHAPEDWTTFSSQAECAQSD